MKKYLIYAIMVITGLFSVSCEKMLGIFEKNKAAIGKSPVAVCISNSVPLYRDTALAGDIIARLVLGETVTWTGDTASGDENSSKRLRVTLADNSTSGWVNVQYVVRAAVTGAALRQTQLYSRPDTITVTENKLEFMDMVAITAESDKWFQVIGENRVLKGWVRAADIVTQKQEVASAIFAREKLKEENTLSRMQKLDYIILNAPFLNSYFIEDVRKMRALEAIYNIPVSQNGSFTTETENQTDSISF